jgi:Probable Zinc-ribbon domain
MAPRSLRLDAIAALLGLPGATIERRLRRAGVRQPGRLSMRELAAVLTGESLARARAEVRERRMRAHGSRYWVAGYPRLLAQWHPTKNGDLFPDEVSYGSTKRIWWKCHEGPDHEWCVSATNRTSHGRGCPFCANRAVSVTNSLASLAPHIAREWHPTRNGKLTPDRIVAKSHRRVWWRCSVDPKHVWLGRLNNRWWNDTGCPFCTNQRVSKKNSLAATLPALAREWDTSRNGALTPRDVARTSKQKAWWRCSRNPQHRWEARIGDRTKVWPRGCPRCALNPPGAALADRSPELVREWDPARNGKVKPTDVSHGSHFRAWWRCAQAPAHRWIAPVNERSRGTDCPFCAGKRRVSGR